MDTDADTGTPLPPPGPACMSCARRGALDCCGDAVSGARAMIAPLEDSFSGAVCEKETLEEAGPPPTEAGMVEPLAVPAAAREEESKEPPPPPLLPGRCMPADCCSDAADAAESVEGACACADSDGELMNE